MSRPIALNVWDHAVKTYRRYIQCCALPSAHDRHHAYTSMAESGRVLARVGIAVDFERPHVTMSQVASGW